MIQLPRWLIPPVSTLTLPWHRFSRVHSNPFNYILELYFWVSPKGKSFLTQKGRKSLATVIGNSFVVDCLKYQSCLLYILMFYVFLIYF